jgi:hypothetical protein
LDGNEIKWRGPWALNASGDRLSEATRNLAEEAYYRAPIAAPDVVVLDGQFRARTVEHVLTGKLIQSADLIIVDNSQVQGTREQLERNLPNGFARFDYLAGDDDPLAEAGSQTTILVRNGSKFLNLG